jgi:glycosyltransferase involved in cell wall biosynthesis
VDVLAVAPYVPYDGIPHAGGAYLLRHLQQLHAEGHRVALIAPGTPEQLAHVPSAPEWLELVTGPHVLQGRSTARRVVDALYRRAMNVPPAPSAESLRSVVRAGLIDRARLASVVELHWAEYARFAMVLRGAGVTTPICVVEHDVDLGAGARRVQTYATGYRRAAGLVTAPLARRHELKGLQAADVVLVFKPADEQELRRAGVTTEVVVIDPALDQPDGLVREREPGSVLFAGALWRRENEDGLLWFLERVWPLVHAAIPAARIVIVGAAPTGTLTAAAQDAPGVDLVGEVPDLMPFYLRSSLFVAPLFVPGGLKFKVPQAMLCGLPVVATRVAVQGVVEVAPTNTLWAVTDDPAQMAAGVVTALRDPSAAAEVGRAAARWSQEFYSFQRSIARVIKVYQGLRNRG